MELSRSSLKLTHSYQLPPLIDKTTDDRRDSAGWRSANMSEEEQAPHGSTLYLFLFVLAHLRFGRDGRKTVEISASLRGCGVVAVDSFSHGCLRMTHDRKFSFCVV